MSNSTVGNQGPVQAQLFYSKHLTVEVKLTPEKQMSGGKQPAIQSHPKVSPELLHRCNDF